MEEKFIQVGNLKIFTRIAGEGNPFLILHGWGASIESWDKVQKKLSENFQVFVLDFPGFGKSDLPLDAWEVQDYVKFILDFSQRLGLEKFYLLGHSFGGRVAIKFAAQFPQRIQKLILVDSAGIKLKKGYIKKIVAGIASVLSIFKIIPGFQIGRKFFYRFILRKTDYLKAIGIMKEVFKKVVAEDLTHYLEKIITPTLIVWGNRDKITPIKGAYLMREKIKISELEVLNCAHCPHLDAPTDLVKLILDFVNPVRKNRTF